MAQAQTKSATLIIKQSVKYQYIDGFGGAAMNGQWADIYTQAKVNKLWGQGDGQIGLNIMRIRINPTESNWGEYGNPIKWGRALNPHLQVFATPWTPPKMYKTSKSEIYKNDFGTNVWPLVEHSWGGQGSNGGAINPECYDEYADFLERYRQTMEQKGCPIDIISIQNESDYTPTGEDHKQATYESCIYSPKEMAAMAKAARKAVDPKCKIMGPETFGWDQHKYNNALVAMQDAVDNIDVWGNHLYGTNDWSFVKNVTDKTGKHMWMTEFLINYPNSGYTGQFSAEHEMIKSIEQAMASGYNAYVYYNMLNDFFAVNHGGSETELWKRAYVFGHYAKYATGKTRVQSTLTDENEMLVGGSSYLSASGDTLTLFLLNTSTSDTYKVTTQLPFTPVKATQVITSDAANMLKTDVTAQYANKSKIVTLQLLPNVFYTFQFVKSLPEGWEEETEVAASPKQPTYSNPLWANHFMADPTAVEYDGRLYVYATNDQQQFDYGGGAYANDYSKITSLVCLSTADLVNWTNHGVIDVKAAAPWISTSWAPSVVSREEADGKTHFYLYFTNTAAGIGVLTSTSPTGPWTDPLGKALIDSKTEGLGKISNIIDPGVCIKPDGSEAYLTFGGGDVTGTTLQPGNARIVKLGDDMISLASDIKTISAPCHFEANELNYIGSRWVYSYCTRWSLPSADEWTSYSKTKAAPTACSIVYMTTKGDPLADDWTYQGEIMPNPGHLGYPYGNNHTRIQKFGTATYLLYHTQWLERQLGYTGGYRNLQMNRLVLVESTAKINPMSSSSATIGGVSQLTAARINPYEEQSGAMAAVSTNDWWMVRGVNFAAGQNVARSLILKGKGTGTLEVRLGDAEATPIATAEFDGAEEQTVVVPLTEEVDAFQQYLYFTYANRADAQVLSWQFSPLSADEATGISIPSAETGHAAPNEWYTLTGVKLSGRPAERGVYIRNGEKVIIK